MSAKRNRRTVPLLLLPDDIKAELILAGSEVRRRTCDQCPNQFDWVAQLGDTKASINPCCARCAANNWMNNKVPVMAQAWIRYGYADQPRLLRVFKRFIILTKEQR